MPVALYITQEPISNSMFHASVSTDSPSGAGAYAVLFI